MKETKIQKEFRLMMNDVLATEPQQKHVFETKNFYKDYPCDNCGATDNRKGSTCQRHKLTVIKEKFYPLLSDKEELKENK